MPADLILEPFLIPSSSQSGPASTTVAAGAGAGTTPPAPTITPVRGMFIMQVSAGTGTTPAAGIQAAVTFPASLFSQVPYVIVIAANTATAALVPEVNTITTTGFNISTENAPAASQALGTYLYTILIIPLQ